MTIRASAPLMAILASLLLGVACGKKAGETPAQPQAGAQAVTPPPAQPPAGPAAAPVAPIAPVAPVAPAAPAAPVASVPAAPATPAAPVVPAQPLVLEVPAGTHLKVALTRGLATNQDHVGDPWEGTLAATVRVGGQVAWPKGASVKGVITQSAPAGRLKGGQGGLAIRVRSVAGQPVTTGAYTVLGASRKTRDTKFIGGTAALGALVGIFTSRGHQADHALGGAAIGAAAGTGLAAATADTVIRIPAESPVVFALSAAQQVTR